MSAPATPVAAADPAPLLGRDATTARVADAARRGPGVVVCGVQGVGRTSVLAAARHRLTEAGTRAVTLHPAEPGSPPFAALLPLLDDRAPTIVDAASLAAAGDALVAAVGEVPFVVVVDDIDTLARPDAVVLHQLVASGRAHLLASVALDRPPPADAGGAWWWDLSVRVELVPLERAEADQLAEVLVGGPIDAVSRERLWDGTRGKPGWLTAVVSATREGGWSCPAGLWTLDEHAAGPADAAVLAELSALPADARTALEALALADGLPIEAAEALGGPAALVEAERRGLVRTEDAGDGALVCEVASRLVSSALRTSLDPVVRERRWGRVAEVLACCPGPSPTTTLVLGLALVGAGRAGSDASDRDLDALLAAAAAGHTLSRWEESADLAGRVWRARADDEALSLITLALGATGDHVAIRALSEELHRADVAAAAPLHAAAIAISQFHTDDAEGAFATVERARAVTPREARGDLDVLESRLRSFVGDQDAALDLAGPWCDGDDPGIRVEALTVRASVAGIRGDGEAAVAGYDEALELALSQAEAPLALAGTPYLFRLSALADLGRLDEAIAGAEAVRTDVLRDADATAQGWLALHLGRCHLAAGRPRTAARLLAEAVHDLRPLHRPGWLAHPAAGLVAAHAAAGDRAAAVAARDAWAAIPSHAVALFRPEELRLVAWLDAAQGDLRAAAERLVEARDRARSVGSVPYEVAALHDLVRLLPGPARSLAADDLAAHDPGNPLVAAHAAQARALVDGSTDDLAEAARAYEALGARLDAAETWAEVGRRTDDERARAQAGRRLAELVGSEGVSTPLLSGVEERPALTDREQEIAALVAGGASRREVAEHLVVSVRTIDSHLQRVYRKLGVRGRDELVAVLGRSRPRS